jgi:hypothetical protein
MCAYVYYECLVSIAVAAQAWTLVTGGPYAAWSQIIRTTSPARSRA